MVNKKYNALACGSLLVGSCFVALLGCADRRGAASQWLRDDSVLPPLPDKRPYVACVLSLDRSGKYSFPNAASEGTWREQADQVTLMPDRKALILELLQYGREQPGGPLHFVLFKGRGTLWMRTKSGVTILFRRRPR